MRAMTLPGRDELIAAAQIVGAAIAPTAQIRWPLLGARTGAEVWVKHENHSPVGAFKLRGGIVYIDGSRARRVRQRAWSRRRAAIMARVSRTRRRAHGCA